MTRDFKLPNKTLRESFYTFRITFSKDVCWKNQILYRNGQKQPAAFPGGTFPPQCTF